MKNIDIIEILYQEYKSQLYTDLYYKNEFTLVVAVILSARTKDEQVNKINLFEEISEPKDILNMGIEKLTQRIRTIGLYKSKAKNIFALSEFLINNNLPNSFEELVKLPGIGRKTANIILNIIFKKNTVAVDTHVFRVSTRIGLSKGKNVKQVEQDLIKIASPHIKELHHILIRHGKNTCIASKPKCTKCAVAKFCDNINKNK